MNKEQLIALGLTEEQADKVIGGFGQMVPKSRLDDKIAELNEAKKEISTRDTQLEELKKVDAKGLQAKIDELQQANETAKNDYEAKLKDTQLSSAIKLAVAGKVYDAELIIDLIDKNKIELGEDGKVMKGLDEQLKSLQESKSFLFTQEKSKQTFKGWVPATNETGGENASGIGSNFAKMANEKGSGNTNTDPWGQK